MGTMEYVKTTDKFFVCECRGEGILLTKFEDGFDREIYLTVFTQGSYCKAPSFWKRLKFCWWHLRTGKYYDDEIILSFSKAREIAEWISDNTKQKDDTRGV